MIAYNRCMSDPHPPTDVERIAALEARVAELETALGEMAHALDTVRPFVLTMQSAVNDALGQLETDRQRRTDEWAEVRRQLDEHRAVVNQGIASLHQWRDDFLEESARTASDWLSVYDRERARKPGLTLKGFAAQHKLSYSSLRTANTRRKKRG